MHIYVLCPDYDEPKGGIRKLYRHVDVLNDHGFSASILHKQRGFRCTWFKNRTKIAYFPDIILPGRYSRSDYLVVPEIYGPAIANIARDIKKVIFNQSGYYTFLNYSLEKRDLQNPYLDDEVVATIVVSEDSLNYLQHVFPKIKVFRIHNGIDPLLFYYVPNKQRKIAFMVDKNTGDIVQVINILKFRNVIGNYDLVPIKNNSEAEVAKKLRNSAIFLSFSGQEGFSLPPAEAMACGCIVVGYHGMGGREYFHPAFSYPVPMGDVIAFAKTAEQVISAYETDAELIYEQGRMAAHYIREHYSPEREAQDIVSFWCAITR